jgi:hypothetical protein
MKNFKKSALNSYNHDVFRQAKTTIQPASVLPTHKIKSRRGILKNLQNLYKNHQIF